MAVQISEHFGLVIRKSALIRRHISVVQLKQVMETEKWFDEDEQLISVGPHFGGEAANKFSRRLEKAGLVYGEDFIDFADLLPPWCKLSISLNDVTDTFPSD